MIDFSLTEEQQEIRRVAKEFAEREVKPLAAELDRIQDPTKIWPRDLYVKANKLGYNKMLIPEKYGGPGMGEVEACLVVEELSTADAGMGSTYFVQDFVQLILSTYATEEQKRKFFGECLRDPEDHYFMSIAASEHGSVGDLGPRDYSAGRVDREEISPMEWFTQTTLPLAQQREYGTIAERDGDYYVINGTKRFITNAGQSKLYVVWARPSKEATDLQLISFTIPVDTPGLSIGHIEDKMGQRLMQNAEVILDNVRVHKDYMFNPADNPPPKHATDAVVSAVFVGLARRAYEEALAYAKQRYKMGTRIIHHQMVRGLLVDMALSVLASRMMMLRAAWENDNETGAPHMARGSKIFCSNAAIEVTTKAMQVFGGYGYMKDFPMEKLYRDARLGSIYHSTNEQLTNEMMRFLGRMSTIY